MNLKIKALETQFKPSFLTREGRPCPNYKVALLEDIDTGQEYGYRITEDKKFKYAKTGDVFINFELQRNNSDKPIVSTSNHDREIFGMQLVKPASYQTSELIKKQ